MLLKHFSDPRRLQILLTLFQGEKAVGQLAKLLGVTAPAISHHLQTLRVARLVAFRRQAQTLFYRLNDDHVKSLIQLGQEHFLEENV
jgi:ArsR family transcriptional regulator